MLIGRGKLLLQKLCHIASMRVLLPSVQSAVTSLLHCFVKAALTSQILQPEEGRPSATVPPPRNTYDDPKPAAKVNEEAAPKAASKAAESASKAASEAPKAVSESASKAAFKATNETPKATTKPFSEEYKNAKAVVQPEPTKEVSYA